MGSGNRELGGVQYAHSEAASDPVSIWVPRRPERQLDMSPEETDCVWAHILSEP